MPSIKPRALVDTKARAHARRLSYVSRAVLLAHVNGPAPIVAHGERGHSTLRLIGAGLLNNVVRSGRRRGLTVLTERGREVLCGLLAEYAEALVANGFSEPRSLAVLSDRLLPPGAKPLPSKREAKVAESVD